MTDPTNGSPSAPPEPKRDRKATTRRPHRKLDWDAIRRDYEFGGFTLSELELRHDVPQSYICRKAKDGGWKRDVRARAKATTGQALAEEIYKQLAQPRPEQPAPTTIEEEARRAVDQIVEVNKVVLLRHHKRFARAGELAEGMLEELAKQAALAEHTELLARILAGEEPNAVELAKARDAIVRTVDLFRRSTVLGKIVETVVKLADAERKALGLDEAEPAKPNEVPPFSEIPPEKRMDAIMGLLRG